MSAGHGLRIFLGCDAASFVRGCGGYLYQPALGVGIAVEQFWRIGQGFSTGLMQLARERCTRLHERGLLELVPGPRGGRGWKFTALARERYSDCF